MKGHRFHRVPSSRTHTTSRSEDELLLRINGPVTIDNVVVIGDDVTVVRGNLIRDTGATVSGSITEGDFQVSPWDWGLFWAFLWFGGTLIVLVPRLLVAGTQLGRLLLRSRNNDTSLSGGLLAVAWYAWRGSETEAATSHAKGSTIKPAV